MVKLNSDIFDSIRGSFKRADLTFQTRKIGIVLEDKPIPSYRRTEAQDRIRTAYRQCCDEWKQLSEEEKEAWREEGTKRGITAFNAFLSNCIKQKLTAPTTEFEQEPTAPTTAFYYEVIIDNTQNSNDLADYQVLLVVNADQTFFSTFNNDHKYLEAYDSDQQTAIAFFIEEWDTTNYNAKIWFKIPSIPANGTKEIYLKANLERTESLSNPNAVFDFFDDFNTPDKWSLHTKASIHDSVLDYTLGGNNYVVEKTTKLQSRNIIIEHLTKVISRIGPNAGIDIMLPVTTAGDRDDSIPGDWYLVAFESAGYYRIWEHTGTTYTKIREIAYSIPTGQWLRCKTVINETADGVRIRFYVNDSLIDDFTDRTPITTQDGYLAFREGDMEHDWVRVRKYTEPEPTVSYVKL